VADARVAEAKRLTGGLRRDRRQHPHRGRGEYSGRAREVAGAIADMIESGGAADAVPLARRAVERVTAAMLHMDDSPGIIGGDLRMLTALYARACRAAPPDARQLAAWLVTSRLDGPGWPDIELAGFADALGQTGLDEVTRLVAERRTAAGPDSRAATGVKFLRQPRRLACPPVDRVRARSPSVRRRCGDPHRTPEALPNSRSSARVAVTLRATSTCLRRRDMISDRSCGNCGCGRAVRSPRVRVKGD